MLTRVTHLLCFFFFGGGAADSEQTQAAAVASAEAQLAEVLVMLATQ